MSPDDEEGSKKRRSRWEKEEKPDAGAIMVSPLGVPQAVVLAGGIKVPTAICFRHQNYGRHDCSESCSQPETCRKWWLHTGHGAIRFHWLYPSAEQDLQGMVRS